MKQYDISPWISIRKGGPEINPETHRSEDVLALTSTGIFIPAFLSDNGWCILQVNGKDLQYAQIEGVEILAWMYVPFPMNILKELNP